MKVGEESLDAPLDMQARRYPGDLTLEANELPQRIALAVEPCGIVQSGCVVLRARQDLVQELGRVDHAASLSFTRPRLIDDCRMSRRLNESSAVLSSLAKQIRFLLRLPRRRGT